MGGIPGEHTARKVFGYLPRLLAFALRRFPLARLTFALALMGVLLEYGTLSLMLPLVGRGTGSSAAARTLVDFWNAVAAVLGFPATQQTWLWMFLLLLGLRILVGFAQITVNIFVSKQIHAYLSDKVFRKVVIHEPLARIFRRTIGYYVSLAGDETYKAGSIFFYFGQVFASGLSALGGLAILLGFSPAAFWLTAGFIVVCGLLLMRGMRLILQLSSRSLELSRALNTNFIEAMNGLRSVRSLSAEQFVVAGYRDQIRSYVRVLFWIDTLNQGYKALPALLLIAIGMVWLWPAGADAASGQGGTTLFFFAITTMLIRILTAAGEMVIAGGKLVADIRASHGAGELLVENIEEGKTGGRERLDERIESIRVRNVSCGYEPGTPVLRSASIDFTAGRAFAIVGESGVGKSTLADVLLNIVPFSAGQILINGRPLSTIDIDSLRSRIILVEQQTRIFTGTLRQNVRMGREASDEEVVAALRAAGLAEFLERLPQKLETVLDYQGANLSGGQRQRIGIARALLRRPDVLIVDEGTSAVDPAMKKALVESLRQQFSDRILIFITHDVDILAYVDEVWCMEKGALVRASGHGDTRVGEA